MAAPADVVRLDRRLLDSVPGPKKGEQFTGGAGLCGVQGPRKCDGRRPRTTLAAGRPGRRPRPAGPTPQRGRSGADRAGPPPRPPRAGRVPARPGPRARRRGCVPGHVPCLDRPGRVGPKGRVRRGVALRHRAARGPATARQGAPAPAARDGGPPVRGGGRAARPGRMAGRVGRGAEAPAGPASEAPGRLLLGRADAGGRGPGAGLELEHPAPATRPRARAAARPARPQRGDAPGRGGPRGCRGAGAAGVGGGGDSSGGAIHGRGPGLGPGRPCTGGTDDDVACEASEGGGGGVVPRRGGRRLAGGGGSGPAGSHTPDRRPGVEDRPAAGGAESRHGRPASGSSR